MIHNSLFQFLKDDPDVGSIVDDRIYHEWVPQSETTFPALVFQQVAGQEFASDMDAPNDRKIEQANYQFDLYARNSADVINGAQTLDSVLRNLRGTIGAVDVQHVEQSNITHLGEIVGDKQVRRVSIDYVIYYNLSEA